MLQDMIEKPAHTTGYRFAPGLVERILQDAGQEPGNQALVEYALTQLFERRKDRTFTMEAYRAIGGVVGAIATKANEVVSGLDEEVRGAFDRVFAELVHLERERPPTRRRAAVSTFSSHQVAMKLIDALAGQECRVLVRGGPGQEAIVEVAHEKLFSAWPELKRWIDESGEALRDIEHAEEEARRWQSGGDNPQELWLASRAKKVLAAIERFGKRLSPELRRFLRPQEVLIARLNENALSHQERLLIGQKLAEFGDPRPGVGVKDGVPDIDWIKIPGGSITLEDVDHMFEVRPFRMAKYLVTNSQFETFLNAENGYRNEEWWKDIEQREEAVKPSWQETNAPREKVSWYEAVAFCRWLSAKFGTHIRLPTEWEWQQAATGGDLQRAYPWGGGWDESRCNSTERRLNRTTAVGMYPQGATQQGVMDMAGNVWEWCLNDHEHPERPEAVRIVNKFGGRAVRGGSWSDFAVYLHVSRRHWDGAVNKNNHSLGFRLVQEIP
jgi:formylglycine-generating enzyme required for sulfatase activity